MILSKIEVSEETMNATLKELKENENFEENAAQLNKTHKSFLLAAWITSGVVGIALLIVFLCLNDLNLTQKLILGIICGLGFGLFLFFIIWSIGKKKMRTTFQQKFLPSMLKSALGDDVIFKNKGEFSIDFIRNLRFFRAVNVTHGEYLCGTCLGVPFSCEDLTTYHIESNGKNGSREVQDYHGTLMTFKYCKPSKCPIYLKTSGGDLLGNLYSIGNDCIEGLESPEFNKQYKMTCTNKEEAFRIFTPDVQYGFVDLNKMILASAIYKIDGDNLFIAYSGSTQSLTNFKGRFGLEDIENVLKSILVIKAIIKTLDLDNTYWKDVKNQSENKFETSSKTDEKGKEDDAVDKVIKEFDLLK